MHVHRLEKIWIGFGLSMLVVFLLLTGVAAFAFNIHPPTSAAMDPMDHANHSSGKIDPTKLKTTAPFDKPGLKKVGDNEYEAVIIAYAFGYNPDPLEIPVGAKVHFIVTSSDVVHGFEIPGTNVNMMAIPGEVAETTHTFNKAGEYLVLCNEYCGTGHETMKMTINVK